MKTLLVLGYKAFEIGLFNENDPKLSVIKSAIRKALESYAADGLKWLIFGGNLGFEYWVLEVANDMKVDYDFKFATIFPFKTHGQNWNEANQAKLALFKQADFVQYAYDTYEHAGQFRDYHHFLISHANAAYVFYDEANETKLKFLINQLQAIEDFPVYFLTFDALQDIADEMANDWE